MLVFLVSCNCLVVSFPDLFEHATLPQKDPVLRSPTCSADIVGDPLLSLVCCAMPGYLFHA